jgi:2-keto-4-pentenoate hydratase
VLELTPVSIARNLALENVIRGCERQAAPLRLALMEMDSKHMADGSGQVASSLVKARGEGRALTAYPGPIPKTMEDAYAIQDAAIGLWDDAIAGWKIGLVPGSLHASLGADRLAGPIFARSVLAANGSDKPVDFPIFPGGFAAVEAELIFRMGADAPAGKTSWTDEEAAALVESVHVGVETAGSPLPMINHLGPTVVASDFGNNFGVIVGAAIPDWRKRLEALSASTEIDEEPVGKGRPSSLPGGGPMAGLRFLLEHLARRGRPLKAGQLVSSGAVTGVHDIRTGQVAEITFPGCGEIRCRAVAL